MSLLCPSLYSIQRYLSGDSISSNPLIRLGLVGANSHCLRAVACTFSAYHDLKFKNSARFAFDGDLKPKEPFAHDLQLSFLGSFAEVYRTEAIELGLHARCFDPETYAEFVNSQSAIVADGAG